MKGFGSIVSNIAKRSAKDILKGSGAALKPAIAFNPLLTTSKSESSLLNTRNISTKVERSPTDYSGPIPNPSHLRHTPGDIYKLLLAPKPNVVIIGGKSQVGMELSRRYAASGWQVIGTTSGKANPKKEEHNYHLVGEIDLGDVASSKKEYWEHVFGKMQDKYGTIDAVINCAGVAISAGGASVEDINRRPVKPMLEACIDMGVGRYVYLSSKAAGIEEARTPGSYALTKYDAEQDILNIDDTKDTKTTIIRPDLVVSANNPGQFGGPQMMSASHFKITIGVDAKKAGEITLSPVTATDLAHSIINISERNIDTPGIINASGPEEYTMSGLLDFFKEKSGKKFIMEVQLPIKALYPFASVFPFGAFEENHLDLARHHTKTSIATDNTEFERIVGRQLISMGEEFDSVNRPVFGDPNLSGYTIKLLQNTKISDVPGLIVGTVLAATTSRVNSDPHREKRSPEDGVNTGHMLTGLLVAGAIAKWFHDKTKDTEADISIKEFQLMIGRATAEKPTSSHTEHAIKDKDGAISK